MEVDMVSRRRSKHTEPEISYTALGLLLYAQPQPLGPVVGDRVRTTSALHGLPLGSVGVVDEDYGSGVMVAWDNYPYRDGFDKSTELYLLEVLGSGETKTGGRK
jgi:hypothetical protein